MFRDLNETSCCARGRAHSDKPSSAPPPPATLESGFIRRHFLSFPGFRFLLPVLPRGFKFRVRILYFIYVGRYKRHINGERFVKELLALPRVSGRARRDSAAQVD